MDLKFLKCLHCGNIVEFIKEVNKNIICCGDKMIELIPNTTDGAEEKHIPVIEKDGINLKVSVGSIIHPMEENHYIEWIYILTSRRTYKFNLKPGDIPVIEMKLNEDEEVINAYAYCNIHSLWAIK